MRPFDFCPADAARLGAGDEEGGRRCPACGRIWYRSSTPTAGLAIVDDGRALVAVRAREPHRGRFDVPGGFLAPGEHPVEGLKREVKEELGIDVDVSVEDCISMAIHTYGDEGDYVLALGFATHGFSGDIRPTDDVARVRWVSETELDDIDFAWPHDRLLVRKALADD